MPHAGMRSLPEMLGVPPLARENMWASLRPLITWRFTLVLGLLTQAVTVDSLVARANVMTVITTPPESRWRDQTEHTTAPWGNRKK